MTRILLVASVLLAVGCYSEEPGVAVSAGYGYAPAMVEVSPGVQVISDYDYPVFYSNNYYWRYDGGVWYRSGVYNGGWAASYDVPVGVRGIARPEGYVHYRGGVNYNAGYRGGYNGGYNNGGPVVRDHRTYNGGAYRAAPAPAYRAAPPARGPVVRDHRR